MPPKLSNVRTSSIKLSSQDRRGVMRSQTISRNCASVMFATCAWPVRIDRAADDDLDFVRVPVQARALVAVGHMRQAVGSFETEGLFEFEHDWRA